MLNQLHPHSSSDQRKPNLSPILPYTALVDSTCFKQEVITIILLQQELAVRLIDTSEFLRLDEVHQ
ncbi:Unknown protein sequence [Pseudomonas amygdali pv. lachrymans]|nr:Unknown protein sequence [Pseudomonas amygdali pv. lachrymans]